MGGEILAAKIRAQGVPYIEGVVSGAECLLGDAPPVLPY
jgi:hypothetical protein